MPRLPDRPTIQLTGRTWSFVLSAAALNRATSYWERPPEPDYVLNLVEETASYGQWATLLLAGAVLVLAGALTCRDRRLRQPALWVMFAGHLLLLGCYLIFTIAIAAAALLEGQPWSGLGLLAVVVLLHTQRLFTIGQYLGRH